MLLQTDKPENEEFFISAFPADARTKKFLNMIGMFLAVRTCTKQLLGEEPDIFTFQMNELSETYVAANLQEREQPKITKKTEAAINNVLV